MAIITSADFIGTAGTDIESGSYTPGVGGPFVKASGFSAPDITIAVSGEAAPANNGINTWCYLDQNTPGSADYSVIVELRRDSAVGSIVTEFGGVLRCNDAGDTHYRWWTNGTSFRVYKRISGTDTELTTGSPGSPYTVTIFDNQRYRVKFEAISTALKLYTQRIGTDPSLTERISVTDSDIVSVGKAGLWARSAAGGFGAPGKMRWELFEVDGLAGGGGGSGAKKYYYRNHILGAA